VRVGVPNKTSKLPDYLPFRSRALVCIAKMGAKPNRFGNILAILQSQNDRNHEGLNEGLKLSQSTKI
jgi:hypothetical protein